MSIIIRLDELVRLAAREIYCIEQKESSILDHWLEYGRALLLCGEQPPKDALFGVIKLEAEAAIWGGGVS
jgi:hypothetical protein